MVYIPAHEAAKKRNNSVRPVQKLCEHGRVEGVLCFYLNDKIQKNAKKPSNPRKSRVQKERLYA